MLVVCSWWIVMCILLSCCVVRYDGFGVKNVVVL